MTNYELLKRPGMLAAFFNNKFDGFPCGWCGMRSFEECDCVDRSTGCGFDWEEKFKTANRYSLKRMAKEIDRAISGACDICPAMDTCPEDRGRCVDIITEWLVQDNFMYDICMSEKQGDTKMRNHNMIKDVLDETERKYLKAVLRPFKNRDVRVVKLKSQICSYYYLWVGFKDGYGLAFPSFPAGTMYNGMELHHGYTLEELGITY